MAIDARRARLVEAAKSADPKVAAKAAELHSRLYGEPPPGVAASAPIPDPAAAVQPKRDDGGVNWVKGLSAVSDFVEGPLQAGVTAFNRGLTMGVAPAAMDLLGIDNPERRAALKAKHPTADLIGDATGNAATLVMPLAPAAIIDRGITQAAAPLLSRASGAVAKAGVATGANATGGAAVGGLQRMVEGGDFVDGAVPGAVGGVAGTAIGGGLKGGAKLVRKSSQYIDDYAGAKAAGLYDTPELRAVQNIEGGRGTRRAAENAHDAIASRDAQLVASQKAQYKEAIAPFLGHTIDREAAQRDLMAKFLENLDDRYGTAIDPILDKAYRDAFDFLGGVRPGGVGPASPKRAGKAPPEPKEDPIHGPGAGHATEPVGMQSPRKADPLEPIPANKPRFRVTANEPAPTLDLMNKRLEAIRSGAAFESMQPTTENIGKRREYGAFNKAIGDSVPPEVIEARATAAANSAQARRRRDIIYRGEGAVTRPDGPIEPSPHADADDGITGMVDELGPLEKSGEKGLMRVGKESQGATFLNRVGDNNDPGWKAEKFLKELAAQDPEFARQLELLRAKKAQEGVRFSTESLVPTNLQGTNQAFGMGDVVRQNLRFLGARVAEPGMRGVGEQMQRSGVRLAPMLRDPIDAILQRKKK